MSVSLESAEQKIIRLILESLTEVEIAFLAKGFIKERKSPPALSVFWWGANSYIGGIVIYQQTEGLSVERATIQVTAKYVKDLKQQKQLFRMFHILTAHLACTMYFPYDPGPGTAYWKTATYALGYSGGPVGIPKFPPILCDRKKLRIGQR